MFSRLLVFPAHVDSWRESVVEVPELPQEDSLLTVSDELSSSATSLGRALADSFSHEVSEYAIRALSDTAAVRGRCGFTYASHPDAVFPNRDASFYDALHFSVAPEPLPGQQRREMIRCMYGILFAAAGSPVVSLAQFGNDELGQSGGGEQEGASAARGTAEIFEQLAAELGAPDSELFGIWSDTMELLYIRECISSLREDDMPEHILDTGGSGVAVLRGDPAEPDSELLLALANPTSEVIEVNIDQRALGGRVPTVMREHISGDSVFVPQSGNHVLSLDLEPYELMWLDLSNEVV